MIVVRCEACGRSFLTVPDEQARRRVCSVECAERARQMSACMCPHERADHSPIGCLIVGCNCPAEVP